MIEPIFKVLNEIQREGMIGKYAIGGGFGVLFYTEPIETEDLDVFVILPEAAGALISLGPIYDFLRKKGYKEKREQVEIEGFPVQFIPAYNPLIVDAVNQAIQVKYGRMKTRVLRAEHLLAIALQTGRAKDRVKAALLLEQAKLDMDFFSRIVERFGLVKEWSRFRRVYYGE